MQFAGCISLAVLTLAHYLGFLPWIHTVYHTKLSMQTSAVPGNTHMVDFGWKYLKLGLSCQGYVKDSTMPLLKRVINTARKQALWPAFALYPSKPFLSIYISKYHLIGPVSISFSGSSFCNMHHSAVCCKVVPWVPFKSFPSQLKPMPSLGFHPP